MTVKKFQKLGQVLYYHRAIIAVPFFILLIILSRPRSSFVLLVIFILIGMTIRIWAAGYIGKSARGNKFSGQYMITNGPYQYLKHPLYIGNFFLVLGVIILFNPVLWFAILLIILFILEYTIIMLSEINYLQNLPKKEKKFELINVKGEISTMIILIMIFLVYFGQKYLLKK